MRSVHACSVTIMLLLLLFPAIVPAAEECSLFSGTCREACEPDEAAEAGAFLDCEEGQQCCVKQAATQPSLQCCVHSFDMRNAGPANCSEPAEGACAQGSGSTVPCSALKYCK